MVKNHKKPVKKKVIRVLVNKRNQEFRVGDRVRLYPTAFVIHKLPPEEQRTFAGRIVTYAKIARIFQDIPNMVLLDNKLGGYSTWEVNDLVPARKRVARSVQ